MAAQTIAVNPFLDPYSTPPGGRLSQVGQPLNPLQLPPIHTLIRIPTGATGALTLVNVGEALSRVTPRENFVVRDETVGIELNLSLFGAAMTGQAPGGITPVELQTGQTVGRIIPTNFREARENLHLITAQRTGSRNVTYNINELRRIARNLDLPSNGNKDVLAARIRSAVIEFFNIQE
jgi:hypothetical protein